MIDLVYLTWNRREYVEFALPHLVENTDWDLVRTFWWYDDNSADGTRRVVHQLLDGLPVPVVRSVTRELRSPVRTMLQFLAETERDAAPVFAKLDSDIVVPPGWLERMCSVMDRNPWLELLGMEAGQAQGTAGFPPPSPDPLVLAPEQYTWVESSHIGGVGLMRRSAFTERPQIKAYGRFGFTEWQHTYKPTRGWIAPDLLTCDLSKRPGQPWEHLSWQYVAKGWERQWPTQEGMDPVYWAWWPDQEAA